MHSSSDWRLSCTKLVCDNIPFNQTIFYLIAWCPCIRKFVFFSVYLFSIDLLVHILLYFNVSAIISIVPVDQLIHNNVFVDSISTSIFVHFSFKKCIILDHRNNRN